MNHSVTTHSTDSASIRGSNPRALLSHEIRAITALSAIFSLRMLGLFMILPIFSLYAQNLSGASPTTIGFAMGIYGLTQSLFQFPFGYLSDRFGRKSMAIIGLFIFCIGSLVAGMSNSIVGFIIGRGLQGSGAIGSVILALLVDLTREEIRIRAMAVLGISLGFSFGIAFILGPLLSAYWGVPTLFWITALLGLIGMGILIWGVPKPPSAPLKSMPSKDLSVELPGKHTFLIKLKSVLREGQFQPLFFGIMVLHMSLTSIFLIIPHKISSLLSKSILSSSRELSNFASSGISSSQTLAHSWQFYVPVLLGAFLFTLPLLYWVEKSKRKSPTMGPFILLLGVSECLMVILSDTWIGLGLGVLGFFIAFNCLEATLPAMLSKQAPVQHRGLIFGIFSTLQFWGLFLGGSLGGLLNAFAGDVAVIGFCVILALIWWVLIVIHPKLNLRNVIINKRGI